MNIRKALQTLRIFGVLALLAGAVVGPLQALAQAPAQKPLMSRDGGNVKPNMVFNLDDSGSMAYRYMPENSFRVGAFTATFPNDRSMAMHPADTTEFRNALTGGDGTAYSGVPFGDPTDATNLSQRQMRSADVNTIYYNPEIRYLPWVNADGTRMPNATPSYARLNPINYGTTATVSLVITSVTFALNETNSFKNYWCSGATSTLSCAQTGGAAATKRFAPGLYYRLKKSAGAYLNPNLVANYDAFNINVPPVGGVFPRHANRTDCVATTTSCNQAEERQNFANWFVYYRSRMLLAQGGISDGFVTLDNKVRLGWGTIHGAPTTIDGTSTAVLSQGVRDLTLAHKTAFFNWLRQRPVVSGTPLRQAMVAVGQYYSRADTNGPWSDNPGGPNTGPDKTCRRAYHMLVTDGYWNDTGTPIAMPSGIGNSDNTVGPAHIGVGRTWDGYSPANPYRDSNYNLSGDSRGTLADVAMHFWKNDLRGATIGSPALDNKVSPTADNPAFWQHMVNYIVGLGLKGLLDPDTDLPALTNGTKAWSADKIDDLWHAALNSRGDYFSAKDPAELTSSLRTALSRASERDLLEAGVATASTLLEANNRKYIPRYKTAEWSGDVEAYQLDANGGTGALAWKAKDKLPAWNSRRIFTWNQSAPAAGVTFTYAGLSAASRTALSGTWITGTTSQANLVDFIRGDRTNEAADKFRVRSGGVLGDFINSNPVFAKDSQQGYTTLPGALGPSYATYHETVKRTRNGVLYVGGNDGMLHGFKETKGVVAADDGKEIFAYVPRAVYGSLSNLASRTYGTTDNYHTFFVDGSLAEADVVAAPPGGGAEGWRNYLVGSTGAGARAVFAIDVTDPENLGASSVRWEVNSIAESELGYTLFPIQTGILPNGQWVAIFGNGYGGASGQAYLFVVDIGTGNVRKLAVGAAGSNGLGGVGVERDASGYIRSVYAGDLQGSLWRFDYNAGASSFFVVGNSNTAMFQARDSGGVVQPILQPPAIFDHSQGGKIVVFGTGRLITETDADSTAAQSIYALRDKAPESLTFPLTRSNLGTRTVSSFSGTGAASAQTFFDFAGEPIDWTTKRGWYVDLQPTGFSGLRVIYPPQRIDTRFVLVSAVTPAQNIAACEQSTGRGVNFILQVETGLAPTVVTSSGTGTVTSGATIFDTNGDGVVNASDAATTGYTTNADGVDAILTQGGGGGGGGGGGCESGSSGISIQNTTGQQKACVPPPCIGAACPCVGAACAAAGGGTVARERSWRRLINPPLR